MKLTKAQIEQIAALLSTPATPAASKAKPEVLATITMKWRSSLTAEPYDAVFQLVGPVAYKDNPDMLRVDKRDKDGTFRQFDMMSRQKAAAWAALMGEAAKGGKLK